MLATPQISRLTVGFRVSDACPGGILDRQSNLPKDCPRAERPARPRPNFMKGAPAVPEPIDQSADLQQKYRQFLDLLPLTLALAGLPTSEGRMFSEDQIEGRGLTVKMAYREARNVARECLGGS